MKVLFINRPDAFEVPGGDTVQMIGTKKALEARGVEVDVHLGISPDPRGYDVAHVFNMQRPQEESIQMYILKQHGIPVALSSIFWTHGEFNWAARSLRHIFSTKNWSRLPLVKDRTYNGGPVFYPPRSTEYGTAQDYLLKSADIVLPNSETEASALRNHFEYEFPYQVVVNAVDLEAVEASMGAESPLAALKEPFALVAARWDDRKNLLMLLKALEGSDIRVVFAGNRPDESYARMVMELMPKTNLVIPHLPPHLLLPAMRQARIHLQPSWFETPGLSSLEAALCGARIVVGNRATEYEYFQDDAFYCDPGDVGSIRDAVLRAWEDETNREKFSDRIRSTYTWKKSAEQTLQGYQRILK